MLHWKWCACPPTPPFFFILYCIPKSVFICFTEQQFSRNYTILCYADTQWIILPASPYCRNTSFACYYWRTFACISSCLNFLEIYCNHSSWRQLFISSSYSSITKSIYTIGDHNWLLEGCILFYWGQGGGFLFQRNQKLPCSDCESVVFKALRCEFAEDSECCLSVSTSDPYDKNCGQFFLTAWETQKIPAFKGH